MISVLIPCYNVANTVDDTIASLVQQTLQDFEVILVDDGSTDDTVTHLQDWALQDKRITVISCPHRGIIPALNTGISACIAEYIARLDADDLCPPQRLQRQVEELAAHPELALVSSLVMGFPADAIRDEFRVYIDWLNSLKTDEDIKHAIFIQSPLAHPSVTYRKEWVERVGGYQDHGWAEDYDLWQRLYLAGVNFGKLPEVLLKWRDHPRRLTRTDDRYSTNNDLRLKAYYLLKGQLSAGDAVIFWGNSTAAHQLGDLLLQAGYPSVGYAGFQQTAADHSKKTAPTIPIEVLFQKLQSNHPPVVLIDEKDTEQKIAIVNSLEHMHLHQGRNWWLVG